MNDKINECYEREEIANSCCSKAIALRYDLKSAIDCNEVAYRAAVDRFFLSKGKEKQKALSDLERMSGEYRLFIEKLNLPIFDLQINLTGGNQ